MNWLNGMHLLRALIQPVKIDSEAWIHLPSRNWYQFVDPERIAGLVSPENVERYRKSNSVPPDYESSDLATTLINQSIDWTNHRMGARRPDHARDYYRVY